MLSYQKTGIKMDQNIFFNNCNSSGNDSDNKVHGANMGPTWVLSAPDGPHVGPMNLAIKGNYMWCTPTIHTGRLLFRLHTHHLTLTFIIIFSVIFADDTS